MCKKVTVDMLAVCKKVTVIQHKWYILAQLVYIILFIAMLLVQNGAGMPKQHSKMA